MNLGQILDASPSFAAGRSLANLEYFAAEDVASLVRRVVLTAVEPVALMDEAVKIAAMIVLEVALGVKYVVDRRRKTQIVVLASFGRGVAGVAGSVNERQSSATGVELEMLSVLPPAL